MWSGIFENHDISLYCARCGGKVDTRMSKIAHEYWRVICPHCNQPAFPTVEVLGWAAIHHPYDPPPGMSNVIPFCKERDK